MPHAKEQLNRLIRHCGEDNMAVTLGTLPPHIRLMSACSGSGSFELVAELIAQNLSDHFCRNGKLGLPIEAHCQLTC